MNQCFNENVIEYVPSFIIESQIVARMGDNFIPGVWAGTEGLIIECAYGKVEIVFVNFEDRSLTIELY